MNMAIPSLGKENRWSQEVYNRSARVCEHRLGTHHFHHPHFILIFINQAYFISLLSFKLTKLNHLNYILYILNPEYNNSRIK